MFPLVAIVSFAMGRIAVFITHMSGEPVKIRMRPDETVSDLKWRIKDYGVHGMPSDMNLLLDTTNLTDDWTFASAPARTLHLENAVLQKTCAECAAQVACRRCGGCKNVAYCSEQCQKSHWRKKHREECGQLRRTSFPVEVQCPDGNKVHINANSGTTVASVKNIVAKETHVDLSTMMLSYSDRVLDKDNMRLDKLYKRDPGHPVKLKRLVAPW